MDRSTSRKLSRAHNNNKAGDPGRTNFAQTGLISIATLQRHIDVAMADKITNGTSTKKDGVAVLLTG